MKQKQLITVMFIISVMLLLKSINFLYFLYIFLIKSRQLYLYSALFNIDWFKAASQ